MDVGFTAHHVGPGDHGRARLSGCDDGAVTCSADLSGELASWCRTHLGSAPAAEIFRAGHLSQVVGIELQDGRSVVIKARPWSDRLDAVFAVQSHLNQAGIPCPAPLVEPAPLGERTATAEAYIPRRSNLPCPPPAGALAVLLAELIDKTPDARRYPTLASAPPWVGWDHDGVGLWPWPDDLIVDMNRQDGLNWIDEVASLVSAHVNAATGDPVIGHVDWESHNLDWSADGRVVVHDWDSLAIRPEPSIAGAAAAVFPSVAGGPVAATVAQTAVFLDAYWSRRPHWAAAELKLAWAAGLWVLTYNAKKESLGGAVPYLLHLERELEERLDHAGL